jgi:transposase-like protein
MGRKSKFIPEEKFKVVETILNGIDSVRSQARLLETIKRQSSNGFVIT